MSNINDNAIFEPRRFGLLMRLDAQRGWKPLIVVSGAILGVLIVISIFMGYFHEGSNEFNAFYMSTISNVLFVGGFIFTSRVFEQFHKKEWNTHTLMIPASFFEKGLTRLLLSTVGWAVYTVALFVLFSLIAWVLNVTLWKYRIPLFIPDMTVLKLLLHYMVAQSLFFLGAALFRKGAFFKTVLSMFGLMTFLSIMGVVMVRFMFWSEIESFAHFSSEFGARFDGEEFFLRGYFDHWITIGKILGYGLIPLFCWTTAFLRLREIEVKDGV